MTVSSHTIDCVCGYFTKREFERRNLSAVALAISVGGWVCWRLLKSNNWGGGHKLRTSPTTNDDDDDDAILSSAIHVGNFLVIIP